MTARTALLLVDLQHDFLGDPRLTPPRRMLLDRVQILLAACRKEGFPVLHARTIVRADGTNRMPHWQRNQDSRCVEGTPGAMPPAGLDALAGESIYFKTFYSAFGNPDLDKDLRQAGIDTLLVAGVHTQSCIQATVLDAYERKYQVILVTDAIASYAPHHADLVVRHLADRACRSTTVSELFPPEKDGPLRTTQNPDVRVHPLAFIDGRWQDTAGHRLRELRDPCDWSRLTGLVPLAGDREARTAAAHCAQARTQWTGFPLDRRVSLLKTWMENLDGARRELTDLIVQEVAKPKAAAQAEVDYAIDLLKNTIEMATEDREPIAPDIAVNYRPRGVIAIITPWNNPLALPVGKLAPALAYGNTVMWKPALQSPVLVRLLMESLLGAGFPANVVNVLFGDADTARSVLACPEIDAVSFTGSEEAGREIAATCGLRGIPLQAELGGNNAVLVAQDADIDQAASDLARAVFSFSGQRCTAPRRIIVVADVFDSFCEKFTAAVCALRIGDPSDLRTQIGPLISKERQAMMEQQVQAAIDAGARLLAGGRIPEAFPHGCWFEPTVLTDVGFDSPLVQNETFGPLAILMRAKDFDDGIALCNFVRQGLRAICYTRSGQAKDRFINQVRTGLIHINEAETRISAQAPFLGWKASGIGLPEHGRWDRDFYTRTQAVYKKSADSPE